MKLKHDVKMDIDGTKYEIEVRELTKKEGKDLQKKHDELKNTVDRLNVLQKKTKRLDRKIEMLNEISKEQSGNEKVKTLKEQEKLQNESDNIEDELVELMKFDVDGELDNLFKARMTLAISGNGSDDIFELAEKYGYKRIWDAIEEAIIATEKKS